MQCYEVDERPTNLHVEVTLADQFETLRHSLRRHELHCNPVAKRQNAQVFPIERPQAHLFCYEINRLYFRQRPVLVDNQFGTGQRLTVRWQEHLCLPAAKSLTGPPGPIPDDLDHFKCYLTSGQSVGRSVALSDQFYSGTVTVGRPLLLCNPVQKRLQNGTVYPIEFPQRHLVCYEVSPRQVVNRWFTVRHQFRVESMRATRPKYVCAPSVKRLP
jgi:hypothetical protein